MYVCTYVHVLQCIVSSLRTYIRVLQHIGVLADLLPSFNDHCMCVHVYMHNAYLICMYVRAYV